MAKKINDTCSICGVLSDLTFEHIPPKGAFNNTQAKIMGYENLINTTSKLFGKAKKSPQGFGGYTLCSQCNNNTGAWYGKDFISFAKQGMDVIKSTQPNYVVKGEYTIKPLNVYKQIIAFFFSIDKIGVFKEDPALVQFILNKESQELPSRYKIYLYSNCSPYYRMAGYSVDFQSGKGINHWAEINFKPFGYLLTIDSEPAHPHMVDINGFCGFQYNEIASVTLTLPYLKVQSPIIGTYSN